MRSQASTAARLIAVQPVGTSLRVLDHPDVAKPKIGKQNSWLWVSDRQERSGYVAAWFVELDKEKSELKGASVSFDISDFTQLPPLTVHVSSLASSAGLRIRSEPANTGKIIKTVPRHSPLTVLDDDGSAEAKLGKFNEWLKVKEPLGAEGYVAAWFLEK
jgi:uncharacterized protein YgiM (DUF1202 family)